MCADLAERRFVGMARLLAEMAGRGGLAWTAWDGEPLRLSRQAGLEALLLCGHGWQDQPRVGDGAERGLSPADVSIPRGCRLYLLGCHQGREDLRAAWEAGTGIGPGAAAGAEGETEALLSTLFLLHLRELGPEAVPELFPQWVLANRLIRPWFTPAREMYARSGGDPLSVLEWLRGVTDLSPVAGFLDLALRQPQYLAGLS
jgi:hypothetical protein